MCRGRAQSPATVEGGLDVGREEPLSIKLLCKTNTRPSEATGIC